MSDWCILRTAGRQTLGLARSLTEDGYDAWTPAQTISKRVPRANFRADIEAPLLPSYVFARIAHLIDLLQLAEMPVKPRRGAGLRNPAHASFSVMHAFGGIPLVRDKDLDKLRGIAAKRTPIKPAAYAFPRNGVVRVTTGIATGLVGVVVCSTPKKTTIEFDGGREIEFLTSILELNAISDDQTATLMAA